MPQELAASSGNSSMTIMTPLTGLSKWARNAPLSTTRSIPTEAAAALTPKATAARTASRQLAFLRAAAAGLVHQPGGHGVKDKPEQQYP